MRLLASYPRDQLDGLLGGEGVHGFCNVEIRANDGLALFDRIGSAEESQRLAGQEGKERYMQVSISTRIKRPQRRSYPTRVCHGNREEWHC